MDVAIGYLHPGRVHHEFMQSLLRLTGVTVIPQYATANLARFRNRVVEDFLDLTDARQLLFVDSDIAFQPEQLEAIIDRPEFPILSGLYYSLTSDGKRFPVFNMGLKNLRLADDDDVKAMGTRTSRVAAVGMGFCCIQRAVLEQMVTYPDAPELLYPFGEFIHNVIALSEDVGFCVRAESWGFGTYLDPNIRVQHYKEAML